MLIIPDVSWSTLLKAFRSVRGSVERVGYLDGIEAEGVSVVTTVTIPNADLNAYNFTVSASAMSAAGKHLRAYGLLRLAQVHTHPTDWVEHSPYDNQMAYSLLDGSISIVLPRHAKKQRGLEGAGIHLMAGGRWRMLAESEFENQVRLVPALVDTRR